MKKLLASIFALALAATFAPDASAVLINGAGSTFDYPAFTLWFSAYKQVDPNVQFNYQSIGSGGGQRQLLNQTVDFGASDAPMTDESMAGAPYKILHFPIVAGAVAISYNLPGNPQIKLDADTLAGIFLGKITKWNDPALVALNPDVSLPDSSIVVVHRSEGSGTTFIFTNYLTKVSPEWKSEVGNSISVRWPVGLGAKGSEGVSGLVKQLPGSICYVEQAYADENHLPEALMKNSAGNFVAPTGPAVSEAMATATVPADFRFTMTDAPGAKAYPIAGASWVVIYQHQVKPDHGHALVDFLKWAITKGQALTPRLHYAPLPENVQQRELAALDTVTYGQ